MSSRLAFEEQRVWFRVSRQGFGAVAGSLWGPIPDARWIWMLREHLEGSSENEI